MKQTIKFINIFENPIVLFEKWFLEAKAKEIKDPNAMNLATIDKRLYPSSRIVLLKSYDNSGFVFYTNINSKKGKSIRKNSKVVLNFYWKSLSKQIRIEGIAKLISEKEADKYFETRNKNSQIGAWASNQSSKLKNRKDLEKRINKYRIKFKGKKIPRPSFWSGYRVKPRLLEFWQEMPYRLHDRVEFTKRKKIWKGKKLFP